ncbi:MAG: DNA polymerase III subunit alpha, partial [Bacteroidetes bacterium]
MYIIFDTETTGKALDFKAPITDSDNWPRMVQIAWQIHDIKGNLLEVENYIIKPEGYTIPYDVVKIHGITTERAEKYGVDLDWVLNKFAESASKCKFLVGHNITFDNNVIGAEFYRKGINNPTEKIASIDTMQLSTEFCAIRGRGKGYKWPKLEELHQKLFGSNFDAAHNAAADVEATARCFLELVRLAVINQSKLGITSEEFQEFQKNNPSEIQAIGLNTQPYEEENEIEVETEVEAEIKSVEVDKENVPQFTHLHLHTQYSILDGMTKIKNLVKKAKKDGMTSVAITDHGNMFGVKEFHKVLSKEGIKPIIGFEAYMSARTHLDKEIRYDSKRTHLVLLAKNETGYKNLMRLSSIGFTDGHYYKPRIDKDLLRKYKEGIIASSACLGGEIPQKLLSSTFEEAEKSLLEFKEIFGDDFYIELQRHQATDPDMNTNVYQDQVYVNKSLVKLAN